MWVGFASVAWWWGAGCPKSSPDAEPVPEPAAPALALREDLVETLHGVRVADPYRWLEDGEAEGVVAFTADRRAEFLAATADLPQRTALYDRAQQLWRYDDETARSPCLQGAREIFRTKRADQDKWAIWVAEGPDDAGRIVLDPNTWAQTETLASFRPSPDCRYAVYGKAEAGDEDPALAVLDLDTGETLPDTFRGWKQGGVVWAHGRDGAAPEGFWYSSKPLPTEKPDGGHFYHHRVWWHALGTEAEQDELVLADDEVKEHYHGVSVSEDGRWQLRYQTRFNTNRLWLVDLQADPPEPVAVATEMDGEYRGQVLGETLLIVTDHDAPRRRVMATSTATPGREHWRELIGQTEDTLRSVAAVGGRLYAIYQHDAATKIVAHELDGTRIGEVALPTIGSASVSGWFSKPEVRIRFGSFARPNTVYRLEGGDLEVIHAPAIPVEPALLDRIVVDQAWFHSADGTRVPMFVVHDRDATGPLPTLLTGYGGFNVSRTPRFSTTYAMWIERGGIVAIPQPARRGRVRQGVARGGDARAQAERLRRLPRRRPVARRRGLDGARAARHRGGIERRLARLRRRHPAPRPVRRRAVQGPADRHGPLPQVRPRQHLVRGVRQRRGRRPDRLPARLLALPRRRRGDGLPSDPRRRIPPTTRGPIPPTPASSTPPCSGPIAIAAPSSPSSSTSSPTRVTAAA